MQTPTISECGLCQRQRPGGTKQRGCTLAGRATEMASNEVGVGVAETEAARNSTCTICTGQNRTGQDRTLGSSTRAPSRLDSTPNRSLKEQDSAGRKRAIARVQGSVCCRPFLHRAHRQRRPAAKHPRASCFWSAGDGHGKCSNPPGTLVREWA
jgi:hypothetical protein